MLTDAPQYRTRVCFNAFGWTRPSGPKGKPKSDGGFEAEHGFGHEEWLFDPHTLLAADDGLWRYTFFEGVQKSKGRQHNPLAGRFIDVGLFSVHVGRPGGRYYVARLPRCQVLTEAMADAAWRQFHAKGHVERMRADVARVGGDVSRLDRIPPGDALNVRFQLSDVVFDRRFGQPVHGEDPLTRASARYQLHVNDGRGKVGAPLVWEPGPVPAVVGPWPTAR